MGENLLLMDSPAPRARTGRNANRDHALLEQADSPCGVDKLLNFSPSKLQNLNKVKNVTGVRIMGMASPHELCKFCFQYCNFKLIFSFVNGYL